jgi:hypothetical protein
VEITLGNTLLASPNLALGRVGPWGLALNGEQLVDAVPFFRADVLQVFARGGFGVTLQFSVTHLFASQRAASAFYLQHAGAIPLEGILSLVVGEGDDTETVYLKDAVVQSIAQPPGRGVAVDVQYTIRGGKFTSDVPADLPGEHDDAEGFIVMRRGKVSIDAEATSVEVTFSAPLSAVPIVTANVSRPSGSPAIGCAIREDSISTDGFVVDLDAATPDDTYRLHYTAIE